MMNRKYILKLSLQVFVVSLVIMLTGCREAFEGIFYDDIAAGDEVMFTTSLRRTVITRSGDSDYSFVKIPYTFTISMFEGDDASAIATANYTVVNNSNDGTLESNAPLYWPSNQKSYRFTVTAGSVELSGTQSLFADWLTQDRLEGASPGNSRKPSEWKSYNEQTFNPTGEDYKKIPLYLRHKRSQITVILKAGEGVNPDALSYEAAQKDISATVYSYGTPNLEIEPLLEKYEEGGEKTICYKAVVVPHNYSSNKDSELITKIRLSNQSFSFYAGNDSRYNDPNLTNEVKSDIDNCYNLEEGKHLKLTVTLSRDSRNVKMTATIKDWDEDVNNLICDDFGNQGSPIKIATKDDLVDFLHNPDENKAGNVAFLEGDADFTIDDTWEPCSLNCTLNLGGKTIKIKKRFFSTIGNVASLQNGTIQAEDNVDAAIAETNNGIIEDVKITAAANVYATKAGAVVNNKGVISKCRSAIEVKGGYNVNYVGGIAATSLSEGNKTAIINACTVTNRVVGSNVAGGIVGQASGTVSNNTFEYGITLSQDDKHKNIVGAIDSGGELLAQGNAWPTKATDGMENATPEEVRYDGIIDGVGDFSWTVNEATKSYRIARDIIIQNSETASQSSLGEVKYQLEGNNKTFYTDKMIFSTISGSVSNLVVKVTTNLVATNNGSDQDVMAPLAYSVSGEQAKVNNVKVYTDNNIIQASNPAGLVVWAEDGATISNCEVTANVVADIHNKTTNTERKYAGGIVALAAKATVTQCVFHSASTLPAVSEATVLYYGGIVGGIAGKSGVTPELTITDCTNFCSSYITDPESSYHGGILGYAMKDGGLNATKGCQGNWWPDNKQGKASKGVAAIQDGTTADAVIGKRNSQKPTE